MKKALFVANVYRHFTSFHIPYIKLLMDNGYRVIVVGNDDYNIHKKQLEEIGVSCIDIPYSRNPVSFNNVKTYLLLKKLLKEISFDIIHVHTPIVSFLSRLAYKNIEKSKLIYTAHGFHFYKGAPLINWLLYYPLEKLAVPLTDDIVVINKEDLKSAKKLKYRDEQIHFIKGVGIDLKKEEFGQSEASLLKKELNISNNDIVITYLAELNLNKNQMFILENWCAIKKRVPNAVLLFVGTGSKEAEYREYVIKNNLADIRFLGYRSDIRNILRASDIISLLSYREGLPKSIMEGMAERLPCIVSDTRGLTDLVENNYNGFIIKKGDNADLVNKFVFLCENEKLRKEMGIASSHLIKSFSTEVLIKDYAKLYGL